MTSGRPTALAPLPPNNMLYYSSMRVWVVSSRTFPVNLAQPSLSKIFRWNLQILRSAPRNYPEMSLKHTLIQHGRVMLVVSEYKTPCALIYLMGGPINPKINSIDTNMWAGQPSCYMADYRTKHGFPTTYSQTIFLRQIRGRSPWTFENHR